jgi:Domain of unknown function (DUF4269)
MIHRAEAIPREGAASALKGIEELRTGSELQQRAYAALRSLGLPEVLSAFNPTLVGELPLDLAIPDDDLNLLCEVRDLEGFQRVLRELFGDIPGAWTIRKRVNGFPSVVARFKAADFSVEICGQPRSVEEQDAYWLMILEERLLDIGGEPLRMALLELRRQGMKTVAAFAERLGLTGDPSQALLEYAATPDAELADVLQGKRA